MRFITNVRIIDGTEGKPIEVGTIEIEGERIRRVSPTSSFGSSLDTAVEVVDAGGATVVPGLINAHEHITWRRTKGTFQERVVAAPEDQLLARGIGNCLISLLEGVTTIRETGAKGRTALTLKRLIDSGVVVGPRVYPCGNFLSVTGGHGYGASRVVDDVAAARVAVRELIEEGAELIKVMNSGDPDSPPSNSPDIPQFSREVLEAVFEEAHLHDRPTTAHAVGVAPIRDVVEAGADCVEHASFLDDATAELLAGRGVALVPTLMELEGQIRYGESFGRPTAEIDRAKSVQERTWRSLQRAARIGLVIGAGVDPLGNLFEEVEMLVRVTMTPAQALRAATRDNARILRVEDKLGTIEPGKLADLLLVDGDPLADISSLRNVRLVVKGGIPYEPSTLRQAIGAALHY